MENRLLDSIFVSCFFLFFNSCATAPYVESIAHSKHNPCISEQYQVESTNQRMQSPDKYFCKEREQIQARRRLNGLKDTPVNDEIGLAFSGGGIRSHAFHLGLMSGLYKIDFLKKVDYISAVSGGSWAAGAYKASGKDDKAFFEKLDTIVLLNDNLDANDKRTRPLFNSYEKALADIATVKKDSAHRRVGFRTQEDWRRMLKTNVLSDEDIKLKDLDPDKNSKDNHRAKRPFIIFNTTHDANWSLFDKENSANNFPFEITSNFVGTIADCGNTTGYCSIWDLKHGQSKGVFTATAHQDIAPLFLSYAMAMSGAVIPPRIAFINLNVMEWTLPIPPIDRERDFQFRKEMVITDGGQSDNLGALALMERKVPNIIITDMAFDPKNKKGDLEVLKHHADILLGMTIEPDPDNYWNNDIASEKFKYRYFLKNTNNKDKIGTILYIKPRYYRQKEGFQNYLLASEETSHLKTYLDIDLDQHMFLFPTDKTFATIYEYKLIFCYYLLGRYFATNVLEPGLIVENWHEKKAIARQ